eukprot:TRINITY_DN18841_c0_g1_i1.p1 TRINITY_DN18841_c0_g1~~TRINITY_DN18841_c0_g1_i1.p1  ORF type:complete len:295 (-),score=79.64 TRINITY_DN18841_c0_g1_i1:159-1043(-)
MAATMSARSVGAFMGTGVASGSGRRTDAGVPRQLVGSRCAPPQLQSSFLGSAMTLKPQQATAKQGAGVVCMGQKVHPTGFRIGITEDHNSHWYGKGDKYAKLLQEDEEIRDMVFKYVRKNVRTPTNYGGVVKVGVDRVVDKVNVRIFTGYPGLLIRNDSVYKLRDLLKQKLAKNHRVLEISLVELSKPDANAGILAEFIGQRLEERVPFRRVAKEVLDKVYGLGVLEGIKIQVAGRLNGVDIARTEWIREGRVPLHTLRAQIGYAEYSANTIHGVLGIKVWVSQGERLLSARIT